MLAVDSVLGEHTEQLLRVSTAGLILLWINMGARNQMLENHLNAPPILSAGIRFSFWNQINQ